MVLLPLPKLLLPSFSSKKLRHSRWYATYRASCNIKLAPEWLPERSVGINWILSNIVYAIFGPSVRSLSTFQKLLYAILMTSWANKQHFHSRKTPCTAILHRNTIYFPLVYTASLNTYRCFQILRVIRDVHTLRVDFLTEHSRHTPSFSSCASSSTRTIKYGFALNDETFLYIS